MIPKLRTRAETIVLKERNPHAIAPTVGTLCEDQDEGIMQLHKGEHMKIQEVVRGGKLKLRKLKEDWVRLRNKIMLMDGEIKNLEYKITQECHVDNLRMTGRDMDSHTTALENCCRAFVTLVPWLQPHLTKKSN